MKAPLPEVPPHVSKPRDFAKPAPRMLSLLCAIQGVISTLFLVFYTPNDPISLFWERTLFGILLVLSCWLLVCLWRGFSLARRIYLGMIALTVYFYFFPDETIPTSRAERIINHFDLANSLFFFIYLNLPNVKAHFAQRKAPAETVKSG